MAAQLEKNEFNQLLQSVQMYSLPIIVSSHVQSTPFSS